MIMASRDTTLSQDLQINSSGENPPYTMDNSLSRNLMHGIRLTNFVQVATASVATNAALLGGTALKHASEHYMPENTLSHLTKDSGTALQITGLALAGITVWKGLDALHKVTDRTSQLLEQGKKFNTMPESARKEATTLIETGGAIRDKLYEQAQDIVKQHQR
jgi:hypothetical protein